MEANDLDKRKVIIVTDGDDTAHLAVQEAVSKLGLRCISRSAGNPTRISAEEVALRIKEAPSDPVVVMVDDRGNGGVGKGEKVLEALSKDSTLQIMGVVVVASHAEGAQGVPVTCSVTRSGEVVDTPVDKEGNPETDGHFRVVGDTVDILNSLDIPVIIGVGDLGKMDGADDPAIGAPITVKAIQEVLNRSGK
jgi:stage V sporulation protein AE